MNLSELVRGNASLVPINGVTPINSNEPIVSDVYNNYLKSGVKIDDTDYPLATSRKYLKTDYVNKGFNPIEVMSYIEIGDFFYCLVDTGTYYTTIVTQTDKNFVPTGVTYTLSHTATDPTGDNKASMLAYDSDTDTVWVFFMMGDTFKYSSAFVYQNVNIVRTALFSSGLHTNHGRVSYLNGFFWTIANGAPALHKFDNNWNLLETLTYDTGSAEPYLCESGDGNFLISYKTSETPHAAFELKVSSLDGTVITPSQPAIPILNTVTATFDGTYYYQANILSSNEVYQYEADGSLTGRTIQLRENRYFVDMCYDGTRYYILTSPTFTSNAEAGDNIDVYNSVFQNTETADFTSIANVAKSMFLGYDSLRDVLYVQGLGNYAIEALDKYTFNNISIPAPTPTGFITYSPYSDGYAYNREMNIRDGFIYMKKDGAPYTISKYNLTTWEDEGEDVADISYNHASQPYGGIQFSDSFNGLYRIPYGGISSGSLVLGDAINIVEDRGLIGISASTDTDTGLPIYTRIR